MVAFVNNDILVIEDNSEMQELLKMLLEEEGFNVLSVTSGGEAIDVLREDEPMLILLDLTLPDMKSDEFLLKVKNEKLANHVPILYFSALPRLDQLALPEGVVGVIQKPFQINEFLEVLNSFKSGSTSLRINLNNNNNGFNVNQVG
jgi:CheY-like chemotaxis protein